MKEPNRIKIIEPVALEPWLNLSSDSPDSLVVQLYRGLSKALAQLGAPGVLLPSTRALAAALGVSRNTVAGAYELLAAEGLVAIRAGRRPETIRASDGPKAEGQPPAEAAQISQRGQLLSGMGQGLDAGARRLAFAPGEPDESLFPADIWARLLRRVARRSFGPSAAYGSYAGLQGLRQALAQRLAQDRGVVTQPDNLLIFPSAQAAMTLVSLCLADPGDGALLENPGYLGARRAFTTAGLVLHALPVDGQGANPQKLDFDRDSAVANSQSEPALRLCYVTPSNQYPLAGRLPLARRQALLDLMRRQGGWIIEDDYDSEFMWQGRQVVAMQGLDPNRVLYLGSVAKTLVPALRLAWLVAPADLAPQLRQAQRSLGLGANLHAQAALAEMMQDGHFKAHLARISKTYHGRGLLLYQALQQAFGLDNTKALRFPESGLQLCWRFPQAWQAQIDDTAVVARLNTQGYGLRPLSAHYLPAKATEKVPQGLIIGFSGAEPSKVTRFIGDLRAVLPTSV